MRGYAGTDAAVEDTVADPYMGFNLGSTKLRQAWQGSVERHYFESPLIRLMKDHGYRDVYEAGEEMPVFTYATPHNGIDLKIVDNVPGFFTRNNIDNFNRGRMREYLVLPKNAHVDSLDGDFDPDRIYRDKINLEAILPDDDNDWRLRYGFDSRTPKPRRHARSGP